MTIIEFLFALLKRWVPISSEQRQELRTEAINWGDAIKTDTTNPLEKAYLGANRQWYLRLLFAVLYIPANKWIKDFMLSNQPEDNEDDF